MEAITIKQLRELLASTALNDDDIVVATQGGEGPQPITFAIRRKNVLVMDTHPEWEDPRVPSEVDWTD